MTLAVMPAAESKTRYMVIRPLNHCLDLDEPPGPSATLQGKLAQVSALKVSDVREQPLVSVQQPTSPPSKFLNDFWRSHQLRLWGLMHLQGLR